MTNKQIIIDEIDVSGCEYIIPPHKQYPNKPMPYAKETSCFACKEHNTKLNFCKNNPNCYYKQLKAKEQECEELKRIINEAKNSNLDLKSFLVGEAVQNEYEQQLDQLKAENEDLKELSKLLEEQMKFNKCELELSLSSEIKRSEFLLKEFKKADKQRDNWREKAENLKQTLTEIKEIAENVQSFVGRINIEDDVFEQMEQILQKISEVLKYE